MNTIRQIYPELMIKAKKDLTSKVLNQTKEIRENTESILVKGIMLYIALNIFLFVKRWVTVSIVLLIIMLFFPSQTLVVKNMLSVGYSVLFK